jgi:hypothetical protein
MTRARSETGALTRVKSASTDVGRTRVGDTFFGSGRGEEGRKKKKKSRVKWAKGQVAVQEALVQKHQLPVSLLFAPVQKLRPFVMTVPH